VRPVIYLCGAPEVEGRSGMYRSGMAQPDLRPAEDARRLRELSAELTGVDLCAREGPQPFKQGQAPLRTRPHRPQRLVARAKPS